MIRPANTKDIAKIQVLYKELFQSMQNLQPQFIKVAEQDELFLKDVINDDDKLLLVAEIEDDISGFAVAVLQDTLPYNCLVRHKYVYLIDIAVSSTSRRMGIGKKLLDSVKEWAKSKNAHHVELNVLEENDLAHKLYLREDFVVSSKTMRFML